jgi:peptide/nickel transport system substrate-binding protein
LWCLLSPLDDPDSELGIAMQHSRRRQMQAHPIVWPRGLEDINEAPEVHQTAQDVAASWNEIIHPKPVLTPNHQKKPFDDVRLRQALFLAIDQWKGAPALSKIAIVKTVGSFVFSGSPLAATKDELQQMIGYWPDIEKSRAEARRLLKEAGQENLTFELLNRNVDQPYKIVGTWLVDEWSKIGVKATQKVVPIGPEFDLMRSGNFSVVLQANCHDVVNPLADVGRWLPHEVQSENYGYFADPTWRRDSQRARRRVGGRQRAVLRIQNFPKRA